MPQAGGDSLLQLTKNRETLIHRASEQAAFARTGENEHFYITNESVMDGNILKIHEYKQFLTIMSRSDQ